MSRVRVGVQNWAPPVESCDHLDILADLFSPAWGQEGMLLYGLFEYFLNYCTYFYNSHPSIRIFKNKLQSKLMHYEYFCKASCRFRSYSDCEHSHRCRNTETDAGLNIIFYRGYWNLFWRNITAVLECLRGFSWQFLIYWALEKASKAELCDPLCTLKILNTCSNEVY